MRPVYWRRLALAVFIACGWIMGSSAFAAKNWSANPAPSLGGYYPRGYGELDIVKVVKGSTITVSTSCQDLDSYVENCVGHTDTEAVRGQVCAIW